MPFFWLRVDAPLPIYGPPQPYRKQVREVDHLARPPKVREEEAGPGPEPTSSVIERYYRRKLNPEVSREPAILAEQIMTKPVTTMKPEGTVREARELIRKNHFHHLPIVAEGGKLVGILSDRDLRDIPAEQNESQVKNHMITRLLAATLDTEIRDAARQMVEHKINCLPILDADSKLLGIITSTDVLRCVINRGPLTLWL